MHFFRVITISSMLLGLTSCQSIWEKSSSNPNARVSKNGVYTNQVDSEAKKITAKYEREYNLSGNTIALYPDFNIRLVSTEIKGYDTISLFEISSKSGLEKDQLRCTTEDPEKKHLYIEDMHFFYHSDTPGKINIYIPPILMASNLEQSNNTL